LGKKPGVLGERFDDVLAAAQVGEEWAVAALFNDLGPAVLSYLRGRAGDEAEDLASQTWLEVARGIARFTGPEPGFRGWVFTIAKRRLANERRRRRRRPAESLGGSDVVASWAEPGEHLESDEAVRRIVALLPDDLAEIVLLRVVAGLPVEEVSAVTGRRPGTVRVMQHRALKRLAAELGGDRLHAL
jgi:RNA polymerase sigma-70 factor (ECF subfamily)